NGGRSARYSVKRGPAAGPLSGRALTWATSIWRRTDPERAHLRGAFGPHFPRRKTSRQIRSRITAPAKAMMIWVRIDGPTLTEMGRRPAGQPPMIAPG